MVKLLAVLSFIFLNVHILSCSNKESFVDPALFDSMPVVKLVTPIIGEASGIADSKINPGYLWVNEDSRNFNELYLLSHEGKVEKSLFLMNVENRDWEDLALSGNDIFLADIGDNDGVYSDYTILQFAEPAFVSDTIKNIKAIRFKYPDGSHDAEALLVDPVSKDIYVITKRDQASMLFKIAYPYDYTALNTAVHTGSLKYSGVVGAAITPDGKEIIIKTYSQLFYYIRNGGESIEQTLQKSYTLLPYKAEPKGEAVTFSNSHTGYFTLSEQSNSDKVQLYFYKRK